MQEVVASIPIRAEVDKYPFDSAEFNADKHFPNALKSKC